MAWHKTCVQPWQYVVAMDMVAAGLRPQKGRTTQTNK